MIPVVFASLLFSDCHDIAKILLKVVLNTISPPNPIFKYQLLE
jgi:hypothetical protein